jgi:AcrR family transcriptional regulator
MPRQYSLGKRAGAKTHTRGRIIAAALQIYRDEGMAAASTRAVARAADVAPATVRNHFPDGLAGTIFDAVLAELRPPGPEILDGIDELPGRVRRLAFELAEFYDRAQPWWRAYEREPELIQAWSGGVDRYYADIEELMRAAIGPLASDDLALAVMAAVIGPPTFFSLRARGLSSEAAAEVSVEVATPWLQARLTDVSSGTEAARSSETPERDESTQTDTKVDQPPPG